MPNRLLAALNTKDFSLLAPDLEMVGLEQNVVLQEPETRVDHVYFPSEGMISLVAVLENGAEIEIAAIGCEGAIGAKFGVRTQIAFAKAIVQLPGAALKIGISQFQQAATKSVGIVGLAMSANDILIANMQQSAACNAIHGIESRLARWLLHARDRYDSDTLPLTQEFLSEMLGVRRPTVTLAARTLQRAGLIGYRRGHLQILDRSTLEETSCECYRVVRRNIDLIHHPDLSGNWTRTASD
jgi:CRP-like cAMP-binding protein